MSSAVMSQPVIHIERHDGLVCSCPPCALRLEREQGIVDRMHARQAEHKAGRRDPIGETGPEQRRFRPAPPFPPDLDMATVMARRNGTTVEQELDHLRRLREAARR